MEDFQNPWIKAVILEHACKHRMSDVIKRMNQDTQALLGHFSTCDTAPSEDTKVDPLYLFVCTLKEFRDNLSPVEKFTQYWSGETPSYIIDLLESTFKQNNYITLKKFLTLTSGLKLLDLLNLIVVNSESSLVIRKLHSYFPKWTADLQSSFEKDFNVTNQTVSEKVKESNMQCRRLILKLVADKTYKSKYVVKQYQADLDRLTKEFGTLLLEITTTLEHSMSLTVLEKISDGFISPASDDWPLQFLMEYVRPSMTEDSIVKFLEDFELDSDSTPCLENCLNPFEGIDDEDEGLSDDDPSFYSCTAMSFCQSDDEDLNEEDASDLDLACGSILGTLDDV